MELLRTARLRFRRIEEGDLRFLTHLDSDPEVMRYITNGEPTPFETYRDVLWPRKLKGYDLTPEGGRLIAESLTEHKPVGWFKIERLSADPSGLELGYRLLRSWHGQGLATEGASALLKHAFEVMGAAYVYATAMAANRASRRVLDKIGMVEEGLFNEGRFPGEEKQAMRYGMRLNEYLRMNAEPNPK